MTRQTNAVNFAGVNEFVVDANAQQGAFTTIQEAVNAANTAGGGTVYVKAGTYTESITCQDKVNIFAAGIATSQQVTIVGTLTIDTSVAAVNCSLQGLRLQGAASPAISLTGTNASVVSISDCEFNNINNTGISGGISGGDIYVHNCTFLTGASEQSMAVTTGDFEISNTFFRATDTASTNAGASIVIRSSSFNDSFDISAGSVIIAAGDIFPPGTLPLLKIRAFASGILINVTIIGGAPASGDMIEGDGIGTSGFLSFSEVSGLAYNLISVDPNVIQSPFVSLGEAYTSQNSNYSIADNDSVIECTANSFTVTLPTAIGKRNKVYNIKNSGTGTITLNTTASQTIDGLLTQSIFAGENFTVSSNNANWLIL